MKAMVEREEASMRARGVAKIPLYFLLAQLSGENSNNNKINNNNNKTKPHHSCSLLPQSPSLVPSHIPHCNSTPTSSRHHLLKHRPCLSENQLDCQQTFTSLSVPLVLSLVLQQNNSFSLLLPHQFCDSQKGGDQPLQMSSPSLVALLKTPIPAATCCSPKGSLSQSNKMAEDRSSPLLLLLGTIPQVLSPAL